MRELTNEQIDAVLKSVSTGEEVTINATMVDESEGYTLQLDTPVGAASLQLTALQAKEFLKAISKALFTD